MTLMTSLRPKTVGKDGLVHACSSGRALGSSSWECHHCYSCRPPVILLRVVVAMWAGDLTRCASIVFLLALLL